VDGNLAKQYIAHLSPTRLQGRASGRKDYRQGQRVGGGKVAGVGVWPTGGEDGTYYQKVKVTVFESHLGLFRRPACRSSRFYFDDNDFVAVEAQHHLPGCRPIVARLFSWVRAGLPRRTRELNEYDGVGREWEDRAGLRGSARSTRPIAGVP